MMDVKYISSDGTEYNFQSEKKWITSGNFHKHSWQTKDKAFGREPITYDLTLTVRGNLKERIDFLNRFHDSADRDIEINKAGKIYVNNAYINGFFIESESGASEIKSCWSEVKLKLYCPDSVWITEKKMSIFPTANLQSDNGFDFPFNFPFDFSVEKIGTYTDRIDHYKDCDFKMIVYGKCVNPTLKINNYPYTVYTTLKDGEYLEIDSKKGTVIKSAGDGTKTDIFNSREFNPSVFQKIPSGGLTITWDGTFGADILCFIERSEPKW